MRKKLCCALLALTLTGCGTTLEPVQNDVTILTQTALQTTQKEEEKAPPILYPLQTVDMVIPFDAGSGTDLWGQVTALYMGAQLDTDVVCTQVTGGTLGSAGLDAAWNADHDGYTMVAISEATLTLPIYAETTRTAQDWQYFLTAGVPGVLWVNQETAANGYDTMDAVAKALSADDESLTLGGMSSGLWYLMSQCLLTEQPFYWLSYATSDVAINACLEGKTNAVVAFPSEVMSLAQTGALVPVAVLDTQSWDIPTLGTIPAITQTVPALTSQFPLMQVQGFAVPSDTDSDAITALTQAFETVMIHPELSDYAQSQNCVLLGLSGQQAQDFMLHLESQLCWGLYNMGQGIYHPSDSGIA